jgi:hypothetical protein
LRDAAPANENRRPVRGKVVPFPTGQPSDSNPFHQTQDEAFSTRYQNPWTRNDENVAKQRINRVERQYAPAAEPSYRETRSPIIRKKVKHKVPTSEKVIARLKVSAINVWVGGWATYWYLAFQLPIALVSVTALGMSYAVYDRISAVLGERFTDAALKTLIESGAAISALIEYVAKIIFGFSFDPMLLFVTPFALVFILGLLQLILTWFIYHIAGIKSLSGEAGGIKNLMFVLAGVGYALPILNLFPLIFLWMIVVWRYPK